MPFEPAPKVETPARTGRFQHLADAMLRGCAVSRPYHRLTDHEGGLCALGALFVGLRGYEPRALSFLLVSDDWCAISEMRNAYMDRYGSIIAQDNDSGAFTREQIAARIAAL